MADKINVGGIYADLEIDSTHLERGLSNARKAMDAIEREIETLQRDFERGSITATDLANRVGYLTQTYNDLSAAMGNAYMATRNLSTGLEIVNANANQMTAISGRMGMALMQFGYILDDLQYGFSGVVNNIGPLMMGLTGNAGIAAGTQVAAVAVYQLYAHWDQFLELLDMAPIRTAAEQLEELGKKTKRTADEQERYNRLKREQLALDKIMEERPAEDKKTEEAVKNAFGEAGSGKVRGALARQMRGKISPEDQEKIDEWRKQFGDTDYAKFGEKRAIDEANAKLDNEAWERAGKLMVEATKPGAEGKAARDSILTKINRAPNEPAFRKGLAGDLVNADPDVRKQQEAFEAGGRANADRIKKDGRADDAREKKDDRADDRRNQEIARELIKGELGALAATGNLDQGRVKSTLAQSGESPERAAAVFAKVLTESHDAVRKNALAKDISMEESGQDVSDGIRERLERQRDAERHRNEAKSRELIQEGRDAAPGVDEFAGAGVLQSRVSGGAIPMSAVMDQIARALQGKGMEKDDARAAAEGIVHDADKDLQERIAKEMFNPTGDDDARKAAGKSEVFSATDLAAKVQAGVGGEDIPKKHLDATKEAVQYLAKMASQEGIRIQLKGK